MTLPSHILRFDICSGAITNKMQTKAVEVCTINSGKLEHRKVYFKHFGQETLSTDQI